MPENENFKVVGGTDPLHIGDPQLDMPGAGLVPVVVSITPSTPRAGQGVSVTVYMSGIALENQDVSISGTSQFWSELPSQITVPEGYSNATFPACVAKNATGEGFIYASCNGGTASGEAYVNQPGTAAA